MDVDEVAYYSIMGFFVAILWIFIPRSVVEISRPSPASSTKNGSKPNASYLIRFVVMHAAVVAGRQVYRSWSRNLASQMEWKK